MVRKKYKNQKLCTCVENKEPLFSGKSFGYQDVGVTIIGFEVECNGIPEKYVKEINSLIWNFLWNGKTNQIERNVMLNKKRGGLNMIDVDIFFKSNKLTYYTELYIKKKEACNVIGKHWLQCLDRKYQEHFFLCRCTSTEGLNIPEMSTFYVTTLNTWTKFISYVSQSSKQDAYEEQLSGNKNITFNGKEKWRVILII